MRGFTSQQEKYFDTPAAVRADRLESHSPSNFFLNFIYTKNFENSPIPIFQGWRVHCKLTQYLLC